MNPPDDPADEDVCHVTTTGRRTGRPHTIEIWFAARGHTIYLLSGGGHRSDWVRNIRVEPRVQVRIAQESRRGTGRVVGSGEEDSLARRLLLEKYAPRTRDSLVRWARTALPVALDLEG